jgi:AraC-like DNA-binding protein
MYRGRAFPELEKHVIYPDREALDILVKIKEYARPPAHPYRSELAAAFLAAFLIRLCLGDSSGAEAPRLLPSNTVFYRSEVTRRAAEYIERNHTKKLTLKEVSEQVGISASYLRSLLLRETGAGFSVHLARARVEAAKKLLKTSFGSIKTIAPDCGFQSLPLFFKLFKRHAGMTPLEYAKSFGDADE